MIECEHSKDRPLLSYTAKRKRKKSAQRTSASPVVKFAAVESDQLFLLSLRDVKWLCQDFRRQITALELVLDGNLFPEERKRATANAMKCSLSTLRKERES
jgi:hypothetical protein